MEENLELFETFLKNRQQFLKDLLLIIHSPTQREVVLIQFGEVNDIIHHFDTLVKDKTTNSDE